MASLIQWTWVWANSGRWWRTGKPGVLRSMGSQRVGHNWATEQQQCIRKNANMIRNHIQTQTHMKTGFKKPKLGDWDSKYGETSDWGAEFSLCSPPAWNLYSSTQSAHKTLIPTFSETEKDAFTVSKPQGAGIWPFSRLRPPLSTTCAHWHSCPDRSFCQPSMTQPLEPFPSNPSKLVLKGFFQAAACQSPEKIIFY